MAGRREAGGSQVLDPPVGVVDRPALVARLDRALAKRVVRLVAPAGYGKSVLLRQWQIAHPDRRVVWMTARPTDDAVHFGRRLLRAMAVLAPGVQERGEVQLGLDGLALGEGLQEVVLAELAAAAPVALVLEDLEALTSPQLLEELSQMAESAAPGVCFVLVSRDDHLPAMPRLRLRDEVAEIRQDALALSVEETDAAIGLIAGTALRPAQIQALHERTEGWPAGVRLAALGVRDHPDPEAFIEEFAGDDRHVADYLSGEVLARQPPEVRDFLIRTSVLRKLSGGLCDALTGRDDGQRMLQRLEEASLFVRPHDDRRQWYSYHPLFRDLLRYELRATRPSEEHELLQRAAAWHLEHGDTDAAAEYLLADEDWPAVVALAKEVGGAYFEQGRATRVLGWMAQVPAEVLASGPDLVLATVALHTMCGTALAGEALLDRFEGVARFDEAGQAFAAAARACWISYHSPPEVAEAAGERALRLLDGGVDFADGPVLGIFTPAATRALAALSVALARAERADLEGARELLAEVERAPGSPVWLVHALGESARIEVSTGNLRVALAAAHRSLRVADDCGLGGHQAVAVAHLALARTMLERGEPTEAAVHLQAGIDRGRVNNRDAVLSLAFAEEAHAALVGGQAAEGLDRIRRARAHGRPPLLPSAEVRLIALEARLHLLAGDRDAASVVLDAHDGLITAELLGARASVAVARGDTGGARKVIEEWPAVDGDEPASRLRRGLWTAVLHDRDGQRRVALEMLGPVVLAAEAEQWVRLVLDAGADALRLVRALYHAHPTPFLRLLAQEVTPATRATVTSLVEQLSERELVVLAYLPSRLSNVEIAARLYVSVNTLKTHLKNIYRKLGATSRGEAIERAEALGLL